MGKLNLNEEQKEIFKNALSEVYTAAHRNGTLMANGMNGLLTPKKDVLNTVMEKYS